MKGKMSGMKKLDTLSSIFWLIISAYITIHSTEYDLGTLRNPGPGFFFFWGGIVLAIFSIIALVLALTTHRTPIESREMGFENVNWTKIMLTLISIIIYGITIERLGYLISTFFLVGFLLFTIEAKKWYVVVLVASASSFLSFALFRLLLGTYLPEGIFGF
jgi:hypothetical protein